MIELLVVMLVIVVLAGLLFRAGRVLQERSKIQQAKADVARLVMALERYYADHGRYPPGGDASQYSAGLDASDFEVGVGWVELGTGAAHLWAYLDEDCTYRRDKRAYITGWPKDGLGIQPLTAGPGGTVLRYYKDPWGNPYVYIINFIRKGGNLEDRGVYTVGSGGPNRSSGSDDILGVGR